MILFTVCFEWIMETAASQWTDNIMCWKNTLLSRTDSVGPHALDISVVYEFYIVLNCSELCCVIEEGAYNMLDV
jgi:hypothetical protein